MAAPQRDGGNHPARYHMLPLSRIHPLLIASFYDASFRQQKLTLFTPIVHHLRLIIFNAVAKSLILECAGQLPTLRVQPRMPLKRRFPSSSWIPAPAPNLTESSNFKVSTTWKASLTLHDSSMSDNMRIKRSLSGCQSYRRAFAIMAKTLTSSSSTTLSTSALHGGQ